MNAPMEPNPLETERLRRQQARNRAVGLILAAVVILIFAVTIVKIKLGYRP